MKELLENRRHHPFSAVYIGSEKMTYGAIKAIKEHGLKIPEDVALVGFDVHDKSGLISPGITSVRQPENNIGNIVADMIIKRLDEKNQNEELDDSIGQRIILEPVLEIKKSSI